MYNYELIRMECQFLVDDFGNIQLVKAKEIWIREPNQMPTDHERMFSQFLMNQEKKDKFLAEESVRSQQKQDKLEKSKR